MIARHAIPALAAALLLGPSFAVAQDEEKQEEQEKQAHFGMYTYVKGMRGDQPVTEENLKGSKVEIEEGELELIGPDGEEQFEIRYTIDEQPEGGPLKISLEIIESAIMKEAIGSKAKAIAKHEGDTITLIYDVGENADYPADFEPDGPTQHLFVLKKSAEAEDDDDEPDDDDDDPDDDDDDDKEDDDKGDDPR